MLLVLSIGVGICVVNVSGSVMCMSNVIVSIIVIVDVKFALPLLSLC